VRCQEKRLLVRCQEKGPLVRFQGQIFGEMLESKREVELRKETTFAEGEHTSQGKEKCGFRGSRQQGRTGRTVWICGGHTTFNVHKN
jgi:hypothetical protein